MDSSEILSEDMPGWLVAVEGKLTIAMDITVSEDLKREGTARELVNRIQNLRKESKFDVTDKIVVEIEEIPEIAESLYSNRFLHDIFHPETFCQTGYFAVLYVVHYLLPEPFQ